jgi:transposase-like protein
VIVDEKQEADYLKSPYHCPYCNSDRICALEFETQTLTQTVECPDCGRQWTDRYTLTAIEPKP